MDQVRVFFLCIHNSARSQMAEAYLRKFGGDMFYIESAGLRPEKLNPVVIEAMKRDGFDISNNSVDNVFDSFVQGNDFDYVITLCSLESCEECPIVPNHNKKLNWNFKDPSTFKGTYAQKLKQTIEVRDQIKKTVKEFIVMLLQMSEVA